MVLDLSRVTYAKLNARQQENYNFVKASALLADYGYVTMRLSDDWQGADFIAQHVQDKTFLRVQLKSRLSFGKKYENKQLYIIFKSGEDWYLFPHDDLLALMPRIKKSESWRKYGAYSFPRLSREILGQLQPYRIPPVK